MVLRRVPVAVGYRAWRQAVTDTERIAAQAARQQERESALWRVVRIAQEYPVPSKLREAIKAAEALR